jgi:Domain of unknown function (DUF4430)
VNRPGLALLAILASALGGCGLGPGAGSGNVSLVVTRNFGTRKMSSISRSRVPGSETVMRMLQRALPVTTRFGGGFVQSIDGLSGGPPHRDWFYYVNGVQAPVGAASTAIHRGDRIWWDLHDWSATQSVPAVVGSFPEPFVHGVQGKRLPTTVECAPDVAAACKRVSTELLAAGVPAASQLLGTGSGPDTLGVVVGTWRELRSELAASLIANGPSASGVYARFSAGGSALELLGPDGQVTRTLGAGAGLVAATADSSSKPTWLITGTDTAGVSAAANALTERALHDHFALAVQGLEQVPVPVQAGR